MGDAAVFADEIFGFHVQQAAKKLFKAWLALQGETYPLSHDLATLLDILSAGGADVTRFDGLVDYTRTQSACDTRPLSPTPASWIDLRPSNR